MTRTQRIALARWGYVGAGTRSRVTSTPALPPSRCWEAMDDPEPYHDVNPSDRIEREVITGGNYGLPCA